MLGEILTDPLEELRDSISRLPNSTVVLGNPRDLRKMSVERGVMMEQEEMGGGGGKGQGKRGMEGGIRGEEQEIGIKLGKWVRKK